MIGLPTWKDWFRKVRRLQKQSTSTERRVFNKNHSRKRCSIPGIKDCALRRVAVEFHGEWPEAYQTCCQLRESPIRPALQTLSPPNLHIPPIDDTDLIALADCISQFNVTRITASFLSDEGLRILLCSVSGKARKIRLGALNITERGWRILSAFISLNEQLSSLEIRDTPILESIVVCLSEAINKSTLLRLSLRKCGPCTPKVLQVTNVPFIGVGGDPDTLPVLAHKTKIRGISVFEIPMVNFDWLYPLCPQLIELELRKCSLTPTLLNPILDKLHNIQRLGLASNNIFPGVNIERLAECEILDVSQSGIISLAGIIGPKMKVLRIYDTFISDNDILQAVTASNLVRVEKKDLDPSIAQVCLLHMEEQLGPLCQSNLAQRVEHLYDVLRTHPDEILQASLEYHFPKSVHPRTSSPVPHKGRALSPTAQDVEEGNFHRLAAYLKENLKITAECAKEEGRLLSGEEVRQRIKSVGEEKIIQAKTKEELHELLGMQD